MSRRLRQRATVVLVRNGRVLLVSDETGMFLMPGGGIEPGEQPMAAAVRELHEENGPDGETSGILVSSGPASRTCTTSFSLRRTARWRLDPRSAGSDGCTRRSACRATRMW